jgi:hypothetical protein
LLTRASLFAGDAVLLHHAVEVVAIDARHAAAAPPSSVMKSRRFN